MVGPSTKSPPSLPPTTTGLLFSGQGSQYVKMLSKVQDSPGLRARAKICQEVLGVDIVRLCLEGPETELEKTVNCQPAMYLAGACALDLLAESDEAAVARPGGVAGLSLGEYTALYAAGVLTFEDGLWLVKIRSQAMQEAADSQPQAMLSVAGLDKEQLEALCREAAQAEPNGVCQVANHLFPKGFSCAGT